MPAPWRRAWRPARCGPVWFRADDDMGHFNTTLGAQALESADQYAFIEAQIR